MNEYIDVHVIPKRGVHKGQIGKVISVTPSRLTVIFPNRTKASFDPGRVTIVPEDQYLIELKKKEYTQVR